MDQRQPLSRTPSTSVPQASYNPNMASTYAAMPPYQNNQSLPPISSYSMPPANQNYMPQQYRNDVQPRYPPVPPQPSPAPDRYTQHMTPQGALPAMNSMLPQPHSQGPQPPNYNQQQPPRGNYPQPLAPAPPRPNLPLANNYGQPDDRQQAWSGAEAMPGMTADGRDPTRTHVVGSQGRRGILPSAPGRPTVMQNGINGSPKGNAIPAKDADGKFPCPNCTKTYLHAKHLKRHMLRHTGDRPYMCVLCNDTFSRSDILKRHFQKCSIRRGNPTGASHLSNPAAHLKKTQAAAAKAAAAAASPANPGTPVTNAMPSAPFTTASMPSTSMPSTSSNLPTTQSMQYAVPGPAQGDMHRAQDQAMSNNPQPGMEQNNNNSWQMHNARSNQMMYNSTSTPDHYGINAGSNDDKRSVMPGPHHMGDDWNQIFPSGGNENYMNPMFTGYEQGQGEVKKEYDGHPGGTNGYYMPPSSLGNDGTLGPSPWSFPAAREDPLQHIVDRLIDFCFPGGIQASLQEQQNNFHIRSCLTVDAIHHFLELYPKFQGHFPWLHTPTFNFGEAYDGVILVIICSGAVYSDRVTHEQIQGLLQRTKCGIERTSRLLERSRQGFEPVHVSASSVEYEELLALTTLYTLMSWNGRPEERAAARAESERVISLARQLDMLRLAGPEDGIAFSYLHSLAPGNEVEPEKWCWRSWVEQEKRSRLLYHIFLFDAALAIYFNCAPQILAKEITLPLPCDDGAWQAPNEDACARALGLGRPNLHHSVHHSGSLVPKQLEMRHALNALCNPTSAFQPRTLNIYSQFILLHALHKEVWRVQKQRSATFASSNNLDVHTNAQQHEINNTCRTISVGLEQWKNVWDDDIQAQYPSPSSVIPRGYARDGVQIWWLAKAFLQNSNVDDWKTPADMRFRQVMTVLKSPRESCFKGDAQRGEVLGGFPDIDDDYDSNVLILDMRQLFRSSEDPVSDT